MELVIGENKRAVVYTKTTSEKYSSKNDFILANPDKTLVKFKDDC